MLKRSGKHKKPFIIVATLLSLTLTVGLIIYNTFRSQEADYLARIQNRVTAPQLQQKLESIVAQVPALQSGNKVLAYPEYFDREFILIPYKDKFGPKSEYHPASSCLQLDPNPSKETYNNIIAGITQLGYDKGRILLSDDMIASELSGQVYSIYQWDSKDGYELTVNNAFKDRTTRIAAKVCLMYHDTFTVR